MTYRDPKVHHLGDNVIAYNTHIKADSLTLIYCKYRLQISESSYEKNRIDLVSWGLYTMLCGCMTTKDDASNN